MPIPLIAAGIIAVGAVTGSGGLALGGKGAYDMKAARDRISVAERRYSGRRQDAEQAVEATNETLGVLGQQQQAALEAVVVRMGEFLRRHAKQVRDSERLLVDGIDATVGVVPGTAPLSVDAVSLIRGFIGSGAAGAGVSAGVTGAVGAYGVASTGAAISGLSGAAAESAALAFLGGGSLASGGGGMALGATALNFVTIGPAILVGGFVVKGQGQKALTRARAYEANVAVAIAEMDELTERLAAVDARADELCDLLTRLTTRAVEALDLLESELFDPEAHAVRFQSALTLVMAVRDIAATPIVDGAGDLNEKTATFSVKYRPMTERADA